MQYYYNIQPKSITVHAQDGSAYVIPPEHANYEKIKAALSGKAPFETIRALIDLVHTAKESVKDVLSSGLVEVTRDGVTYDGVPIHGVIVNRIREHVAAGLDTAPLINFLDKLMNNHSFDAVNSLYDFLEANDIPLAPDGDFIVYKKVRNDYRDVHSGTIDNSIGAKPRVRHNQVNADRNVTCAEGLHVCAKHYLPSFGISISLGGRVVICKVNPLDVVAVPFDYKNAKMRVAGYEVIGEIAYEDAANVVDLRKVVSAEDEIDGVTWGENFQKPVEGPDPDEADDSAHTIGYDEYEDEGDVDDVYYDSDDDDDSADDDSDSDDDDVTSGEVTPAEPAPVAPPRRRFRWFGRD